MRSNTMTRQLALTLLLSSCATLAFGQAPVTGYHMRDCTVFGVPDAYTSRPLLFGFRWDTALRDDATTDVIFDEEFWDPETIPGPNPWLGMISGSGVGWLLNANWRLLQLPTTVTDAYILTRGEIWLDSDLNPLDGSGMGLVNVQKIGALGGDAPEVQTLGDRHRVRFLPLRELDNTGRPGTCTPAGAAPRGFIVGYVVWSLDAAAYPAPTPDDFLRNGARHLVDLSTLDFGVPDPDGRSGSDLDPADGAVLINPDGLPDTGDEIIEMDACSPGGAARWYGVQPVVKGNFSHFDGGMFGINDRPSTVVDLDADTVPDVADVLEDGLYEFSDGCIGLGMLWRGGIAMSASPGLGDAQSPAPTCPTPASSCSRSSRSQLRSAPREPSALDLRDVVPFTVRRGSSLTSLVVGWEETFGGEDSLYVGNLDQLIQNHSYSHEPASPCVLPVNPTTIDMPPGNVYFLVTHWEEGIESSYGRDSFGRERPRGVTTCH